MNTFRSLCHQREFISFACVRVGHGISGTGEKDFVVPLTIVFFYLAGEYCVAEVAPLI